MNYKIGYARVLGSSEDTDTQTQMLEAAGCNKIYQDTYTSSVQGRGKGIEELVKVLRTNDEVVITKMDRIGCNVVDALSMIKKIHEKGAIVSSLDGVLETAGGKGKVLLGFIDVLADMEFTLDRERHDEKSIVKSTEGDTEILKDEDAKKIRSLWVKGKTYNEIAPLVKASKKAIFKIRWELISQGLIKSGAQGSNATNKNASAPVKKEAKKIMIKKPAAKTTPVIKKTKAKKTPVKKTVAKKTVAKKDNEITKTIKKTTDKKARPKKTVAQKSPTKTTATKRANAKSTSKK